MVKILGETDSHVELIANSLREFEKSHEYANCIVYRYNPASIRVKIVDVIFTGRDRSVRHDYAMGYLRELPDDTLSQISLLICLEPGETSLIDLEFKDPSKSML
ncbi:MAG: hypothetical protein AAF939_07400 [Planctomycetota bacterium]